jgi:hypothetical protein
MMFKSSVTRFVLVGLAATVALPAFAQSPPPAVGSAAPPLELAAADGSHRSLATIDGPRVLIFYRGLW